MNYQLNPLLLTEDYTGVALGAMDAGIGAVCYLRYQKFKQLIHGIEHCETKQEAIDILNNSMFWFRNLDKSLKDPEVIHVKPHFLSSIKKQCAYMLANTSDDPNEWKPKIIQFLNTQKAVLLGASVGMGAASLYFLTH